jgi:hypothetical protein
MAFSSPASEGSDKGADDGADKGADKGADDGAAAGADDGAAAGADVGAAGFGGGSFKATAFRYGNNNTQADNTDIVIPWRAMPFASSQTAGGMHSVAPYRHSHRPTDSLSHSDGSDRCGCL